LISLVTVKLDEWLPLHENAGDRIRLNSRLCTFYLN